MRIDQQVVPVRPAPGGGQRAGIGTGSLRWAVVASDGREFIVHAGRVEWKGSAALFFECPPCAIDLCPEVVAAFDRPISVMKERAR